MVFRRCPALAVTKTSLPESAAAPGTSWTWTLLARAGTPGAPTSGRPYRRSLEEAEMVP